MSRCVEPPFPGHGGRFRDPGHSRQRGQALLEACIGSILLALICWAVVFIGKLQSIQQAVVSASNTLAFECSVRYDACQQFSIHPELVDELRLRHFMRHDAALLSNDLPPEILGRSNRNALWVDHSGQSMLARASDIGARVEPLSFDAGLKVSTGGSSVADAARMLSETAGPGRFGLALTGGLYRTRVQATLTPIRFLGGLTFKPSAQAAILTDTWMASGPYVGVRSVQSRVAQGAQLPLGMDTVSELGFAFARGALSLLGAFGLEPSADQLRYHHIDIDIVPTDREGQ